MKQTHPRWNSNLNMARLAVVLHIIHYGCIKILKLLLNYINLYACELHNINCVPLVWHKLANLLSRQFSCN